MEVSSRDRSDEISSISGPSGMIKPSPLKTGSRIGKVLVFSPLPGSGPILGLRVAATIQPQAGRSHFLDPQAEIAYTSVPKKGVSIN